MPEPATILLGRERGHCDADERVVDREQRHRHGDLPDDLGVVAEVVEGTVAHQHLPDEQHDLGQEAEGEHHGGDLFPTFAST